MGNARIRQSGNGVGQIQDESLDLPSSPATLTFVGSGVVATVDPLDPTRVIVTISGGGAGSSAEAIEATFNCTATESVNDAVYLFAANDVRRADAASDTTAPSIGIIKSKPTTTTCVIATDGELGGFSGLIAGDIYYLAKGLPGGITNVPITGPGISQKLGEARNSTTLVLNVDSDFVELT